MDSMVNRSSILNNDSTPKPSNNDAAEYRMTLLTINSTVLVIGTISLSLMMHILKSSSTSITSIAVLNLIFAHFIFLVTVPFRIYYYVTQYWSLGLGWCKVISSMIHIHMYMSFIFYVIILTTRIMAFHQKADRMALYRTHALFVSVVVWIVVLVVVPCIVSLFYGKHIDTNGIVVNVTACFNFGRHIESIPAKVFNYIISTLIIVVATVLTVLQANVVRVLYRKQHQGCTFQQEFGTQLKSLCFALIMVVCFIPYHVFRLYYLENIAELQGVNEVFLSVTTFNCLDMLTFLGRRTCLWCFL